MDSSTHDCIGDSYDSLYESLYLFKRFLDSLVSASCTFEIFFAVFVVFDRQHVTPARPAQFAGADPAIVHCQRG
jgi:hypothetical protein